MNAPFACIAAMLALAALATDAPAAPDKGIQAKFTQCTPRIITRRLCLGGRMVTCQYRLMGNCRLGHRRCNSPSVIIPCSPAKRL